MFKHAFILGTLALSICLMMVPVSAEIVTIPLEGGQQVPPVNSPYSGSCTGTLNALQTEFNINCNHNASSTVAAHIHNAASGSNGPIIFFFDAATTFSDTVNASTLTSQATQHSGIPSFEEFLAQLKA